MCVLYRTTAVVAVVRSRYQVPAVRVDHAAALLWNTPRSQLDLDQKVAIRYVLVMFSWSPWYVVPHTPLATRDSGHSQLLNKLPSDSTNTPKFDKKKLIVQTSFDKESGEDFSLIIHATAIYLSLSRAVEECTGMFFL